MNNLSGFDTEAILRLEAIFEAAASPAERRAGGWLEPLAPFSGERNEASVLARRSEWVRFVANGNEWDFSRLLAARGLTPDQFLAGLVDVRVANRDQAPEWVRGILELSGAFLVEGPAIAPFRVGDIAGALPLPSHISRDGDWRFHRAFEPFLRMADFRLRQLIQDVGLSVSDAARRNFLLQLAQRWNAVANNALTSPVSVDALLTAIPQSDGPTMGDAYLGTNPTTLTNWLGLWSVFPVLARLMAVVWTNWGRATGELLERLAKDLPRIEATLWPDTTPGALVNFQGDSGDTHDGGRSVGILTFASGDKVVYKPKNLGIAALYFELAELLSRETDFPLHPGKRILGKDYSWEEWVSAEECRGQAEIRQYYRRLGAHARLLQFIDAVDMHHENVIPAGPHPTLIDLETIFAPRPKHDPESTDARRFGIELLRGNPAASGIISCKACLTPGQPGTELGAICPLGDGSALFSPTTTAIPKLGGRLTNPLDYATEIAFGYQTLGQRLRERAEILSGDESPLQAAADVPVRFVNRESHVYARLLATSFSPDCLKNGIVRELVLEGLWKGWFEHSLPVEVVAHEIDELRNLDIPVFHSRPGNSHLFAGKQVIRNYFGYPALARAFQNLENLKTAPLEIEADIIRTALFIRSPDSPFEARFGPSVIRLPRKPGRLAFEMAGIQIGDAILGLELNPETPEAVWVGLDYQPAFNVWQLGLLEPGLLTGTGGLAVVFAALWRKTGLDRFRLAAARILDSMTARLSDHPRSKPWFNQCGAFTGIGGMLYAIQQSSRLLGIQNPFSAPARLAALRIQTRFRQSPPDLYGGLAGFLTGLLAMRKENPAAEALIPAVVVELQAGIELEDWEKRLPLVSDAPHFKDYPDARQGVVLTLARASKALDRSDLRPSDDEIASRLFGNSYHPPSITPGFLGGALEGAFVEPDFIGPTIRLTDRFLGQLRSTTAENLIAGDLALTAYQLTGKDFYHEVARREAGLILENFRQTGNWFPDSLAADRFNLSALVGVGAVAYLFLRLQDELPSLRTLGDFPRYRN